MYRLVSRAGEKALENFLPLVYGCLGRERSTPGLISHLLRRALEGLRGLAAPGREVREDRQPPELGHGDKDRLEHPLQPPLVPAGCHCFAEPLTTPSAGSRISTRPRPSVPKPVTEKKGKKKITKKAQAHNTARCFHPTCELQPSLIGWEQNGAARGAAGLCEWKSSQHPAKP